MSRAAHLWHRLRSDETGAALVWFALSLPLLVMVAAFVVNYAKWFEDKRHLQTQVDAAALAGGLDFTIPCDSASDSTIAASALKYSGDTYRAVSPYNLQVSDTSNVHIVLNQTNYWQSGDSNVPASPYGDLQSACSAGFLDVKATHSTPSFFFGSLVPNGILPAITAHARVSLVKKTEASGTLPLAVPDLVPQFIYAQFVNQVTGVALSSWSALTQQFTTDASGNQVPVTDPTTGADIWNDVGSPISVPFTASPTPGSGDQIGLRLKLIESNNSSANCGDPLVTCVDEGNGNQGIAFVRGWTDANANTGPHPVARDVFLDNTGGNCKPDPYFTNVPCAPGITATVDFGDRLTTDPKTKVTAVVDGNSYDLTHGSGNTWSLPAGTMTVGANIGANPITLNYVWWQGAGTTWRGNTCTNNVNGANANPCTDSGSFGVAQSSYLSDDSLSARVLLAQIGDSQATPLPTTQGADSFQETAPATNHQLTVTVGIAGLEAAANFSDPTVRLRLAGTGSNTQTLDCWTQTPGSSINNIRDAIVNGCPTPYTLNPTLTCPDASAPNPPFDCALSQTGGAAGQARQGMNTRFSCTHNNWQPPAGGGLPKIADDDPRLVEFVVTTFGAFNVSGNTQVPVVSFANFYVTGWDGDNSDSCSGADANEAYPFPGSSSTGDVWGHFVSHIDSSSSGSGEGTCQLGGAQACIVVLTQ